MVVKHVHFIANQHRKRFFHKSLLITLASLFVISHFSSFISYAAVSSDENYSIEVEDLNTTLPEPTSPPKIIQKELKLTPTPANIPPPYTITATNDSFSFLLSQTAIDFGALSATNPVVRTSDIVFSTPFYGAQVIGYANHPLMNTEKVIVPDTTCDTGTCSQTIASNWENNLTYGFGFRCESAAQEVCGRDFSGTNSFKQFADLSAKESVKTIGLNQQSKAATTIKIGYKVNISGTQSIGGYSNAVTYLAIPNF